MDKIRGRSADFGRRHTNTKNLLKAISRSAASLFRDEPLGRAIKKLLGELGRAAGVSRVYYFEIHDGPRGERMASQRHEWTAPKVAPQINNPRMQNIPFSRFPLIGHHLQSKPYYGPLRRMSPSLRRMLSGQKILSLALVPVYANRLWSGFIGFDDCEIPRRWSEEEIAALQIAANALGGAIERRQVEEKLRSIVGCGLDSLDSGIFILDRNFRVVWVNRAMEKFFGIKRRTLLGRDKRQFIIERIPGIIRNHEEYSRRIQAAYDNNTYVECFRCEVRAGRGREPRTLVHWSVPIRIGALTGGRIEHYTDVTSSEKVMKELRVSEEKYRNLVERMSEGLSYADEHEVVRYANAAFCNMLGYAPHEIIGTRLYNFLDPVGKRILRRQRRLRRKGEHSRYEICMRSRSGEMIPLEVSAAPVFDENGRFRGGYALFIDIRERRELERMKDDILREASHELKSPAAKIAMGLNLLTAHRREAMSDEELLGLRMIESEVARIMRNIDSFIDLFACESGVMRLKKENFDLRRLLRVLVAEFEELARRKGISINIRLARRNLLLRGDRERIYHLFRNILENSVKFSHEGEISVTARVSGKWVHIAVADRGRGIEPVFLEKMFERYFRRHPGGPGLGIGLALCRRVAELHGGKIWAHSKGLGKGLTVHVLLPVIRKRNVSV